MNPSGTLRKGSILRFGLALVAAFACLAGRPATLRAQAGEETAAPVFTNPLVISNEFLPFVPGAVRVYAGPSHGVPSLTVVTNLQETRDFVWNGAVVSCRVAEELEFQAGVPVGREKVFLAQADDGSVWAFGEVEEKNDDSPDDKDEKNGWIVGQRAPTDPEDLATDARPAMLMPASPKLGDSWTSLDVPPAFHKVNNVRSARDVVSVSAGRLTGCLRIQEVDVPDDSVDWRWYAPGLGLVRTRAPGERATLVASTIRAQRR